MWMRDGRVPVDYPGKVAADYPDLLAILEASVKPERQRRDDDGTFALRSPLPQRWWHYADKRPALYHAIGRGSSFARHPDDWAEDFQLARVFAICRVTKFVAPATCGPNQTFSDSIVVFTSQDWSEFSLLVSSLHEVWARKNSSSLETRLRYLPSDIYETLPRPNAIGDEAANAGERFAHDRDLWCRTNAGGLTDFYNVFHDESHQDAHLATLRTLLAEIDRALLAAYGWADLNPEHGFHEVTSLPANDRVRFTISETARLEVLRRLSALNRQRYQEEQDATRSVEAAQEALTNAQPRRRGRKPRSPGATLQPDMFG